MIYIIEDDADIREMERYALKNSGYETQGFTDADSFFRAVEKALPDLVLLDIMLPGRDGLSVLRSLRQSDRTRDVPVIMVTAKGSELDKVKGLDLGADDYLTKPFGVLELVSRVKALLRRTASREPGDVLRCGEIVLEDERRSVSVGGAPVTLTFKEYELLKLLMRNQGIVLTREKIMDNVWGFDFEGESRTVDMHIKTLRRKLGDAGAAIQTVRNVGYKLSE